MFSLQETFRFLIYLMFKKADKVLRKLTENEETRIFSNKHILAYGNSLFSSQPPKGDQQTSISSL